MKNQGQWKAAALVLLLLGSHGANAAGTAGRLRAARAHSDSARAELGLEGGLEKSEFLRFGAEAGAEEKAFLRSHARLEAKLGTRIMSMVSDFVAHINDDGKGPTVNELVKAMHHHMNLEEAVKHLDGQLPADVTALIRIARTGASMKDDDEDAKAINKARSVLNGMLLDAWKELDEIIFECKEFQSRNRGVYEQVEADLSRIGSNLAEDEDKKLEANGKKQAENDKIRDVQTEIDNANKSFVSVEKADRATLGGHKANLNAYNYIMDAMTQSCPEVPGANRLDAQSGTSGDVSGVLGDITGPFFRISSGTCADEGYDDVKTASGCKSAATQLSLEDTSADERCTLSQKMEPAMKEDEQCTNRPTGCIFSSNNVNKKLEFNELANDVACGSSHSGYEYDCICAKKKPTKKTNTFMLKSANYFCGQTVNTAVTYPFRCTPDDPIAVEAGDFRSKCEALCDSQETCIGYSFDGSNCFVFPKEGTCPSGSGTHGWHDTGAPVVSDISQLRAAQVSGAYGYNCAVKVVTEEPAEMLLQRAETKRAFVPPPPINTYAVGQGLAALHICPSNSNSSNLVLKTDNHEMQAKLSQMVTPKVQNSLDQSLKMALTQRNAGQNILGLPQTELNIDEVTWYLQVRSGTCTSLDKHECEKIAEDDGATLVEEDAGDHPAGCFKNGNDGDKTTYNANAGSACTTTNVCLCECSTDGECGADRQCTLGRCGKKLEANQPIKEPVLGEDGVSSDAIAKKCVDGSPTCELLHDTMAQEWGKFKDSFEELSAKMTEDKESFDELMANLDEQKTGLTNEMTKYGTDFASATSRINTDQLEEDDLEDQKRNLDKEFRKKCKEFRERVTELLFTKLCALRSIRNQLKTGQATVVRDCDFTDWKHPADGQCFAGNGASIECDDACPATGDAGDCGGRETLKREVIQQPNENGMKCPPLEKEKTCSQWKCPVHCLMSTWSGWGACTKKCGSGLQVQTRDVLTAAKHGGAPCGPVQIEQTCGTAACDQNCVLGGWSAYSACSAACDGGVQSRRKSVQVQIKGRGECEKADGSGRLQQITCNMQKCRGDEVCIAKQDLVIAIDASGSVKEQGFASIKKLALELVSRYKPKYYGASGTKIGVVMFGNGYLVKDDSGGDATISEAASVIELTDDYDAVKAAIESTTYQKGFTNMAQVFPAAEGMYSKGREDAVSALMIISDGIYTSKYQSTQAAQASKDNDVRVYMVAVGPLDDEHEETLQKEIASQPTSENFHHIGTWDMLKEEPERLAGEIVTQFCPNSISPFEKTAEVNRNAFVRVKTQGYPNDYSASTGYCGREYARFEMNGWNEQQCADYAKLYHNSDGKGHLFAMQNPEHGSTEYGCLWSWGFKFGCKTRYWTKVKCLIYDVPSKVSKEHFEGYVLDPETTPTCGNGKAFFGSSEWTTFAVNPSWRNIR